VSTKHQEFCEAVAKILIKYLSCYIRLRWQKIPIIWLLQHTHICRKGFTKYAYWIFDEGWCNV